MDQFYNETSQVPRLHMLTFSSPFTGTNGFFSRVVFVLHPRYQCLVHLASPFHYIGLYNSITLRCVSEVGSYVKNTALIWISPSMVERIVF